MKLPREQSLDILTCARLSERVYHPFDGLQFHSWSMQFAPDRVKTWVRGDAEAMGLVSGDRLYIAFRGTTPSSLADWMTDLRAHPHPLPTFGKEATIHAGFDGYVDALYAGILAFVRKNYIGRKLIITGHSLGGSAAVICAARLAFDELAVDEVITFGAAPVGNKEFCSCFEECFTTFRFSNGCDIAPRLPSALPWLEHPGDRLFLPFGTSKVWKNPAHWKVAANNLAARAARLATFRVARGIADHSIALYRKRLAKRLTINGE